MEFAEKIKQFSVRVGNISQNVSTEEATKMSLILPLFQMMGYDVFNPVEFCPEFTADVGIKKGEKVDYAIIENGNPTILIECKSCSESLDKHSSQLFRYFGTTSARFGILTNGIVYRFYTDLEETNKMDLVPFLEIDMSRIKPSEINQLKRFCKGTFDQGKILDAAEELKYSALIKDVLTAEMNEPSEAFVRFILKDIYDGQKNQRIIEKFTPLVKRTFSAFVNEIVNDKISAALAENTEATGADGGKQEETVEETPVSKIVTTEEEIEAFHIIRAMLADVVPIEDIAHRDSETYFAILYKDNNRKPICRLKLDGKNKQIFIPDKSKNFDRTYIQSLSELYGLKAQLAAVVQRYL